MLLFGVVFGFDCVVGGGILYSCDCLVVLRSVDLFEMLWCLGCFLVCGLLLASCFFGCGWFEFGLWFGELDVCFVGF